LQTLIKLKKRRDQAASSLISKFLWQPSSVDSLQPVWPLVTTSKYHWRLEHDNHPHGHCLPEDFKGQNIFRFQVVATFFIRTKCSQKIRSDRFD